MVFQSETTSGKTMKHQYLHSDLYKINEPNRQKNDETH